MSESTTKTLFRELGVPAYVTDINSLEDLKGNGKMFGNKIIGIEPSAGLMLSTEKALKEYGLEDEYKLVQGSTAGMLAAMEKATKNEEPILFLPWRPHTMFQQFDIKLLEDPKGIFIPDDVYIGVNPELKDKAPDIYKFAQNFKIEIEEVERIMQEGNSKEDKIAELARKWIDENQDQINEWVK
jgi:glycine betaine/proline transport system substrate-binding protein